ncbi:MAG: RNA polymerase sigma factor [Verrucomicrobiaceae bacterium]|nr:MAG: RNA polymerase sigma factor [Verrucomicrobiaceae bacterium]
MDLSSDSDDTLLVNQARQGCAAAFGKLVHRHHARVFGFLLTLTRHRQDAEDLTQETFLRAWKKFHRYDPTLSLLPWLFTLARRQSIAALRRARPLPPDLPFPTEPESVPSVVWIWDSARKELSAEAYSAVWLHYAEDLSIRQIAGVLGKREGTVKVILHRARKTLAESIRRKSPETLSSAPLHHEP